MSGLSDDLELRPTCPTCGLEYLGQSPEEHDRAYVIRHGAAAAQARTQAGIEAGSAAPEQRYAAIGANDAPASAGCYCGRPEGPHHESCLRRMHGDR